VREQWVVVVRRENGRYLTEEAASSKYDAKVRARRLRGKYDETYSVTKEKRG
jgi:hypothetical protein